MNIIPGTQCRLYSIGVHIYIWEYPLALPTKGTKQAGGWTNGK